MAELKNQLILSLFPGLGLLDRAFEGQGFTVVRGPDLLWGGDVHNFHPPAGRFDGIIGGPPCQGHSSMAAMVRQRGLKTAENLIPEFARCVDEGQSAWFLMENVERAPLPQVCAAYALHSFLLNNRWLGEVQNRKRAFTFGVRFGAPVDLRQWIPLAAIESAEWACCVRASGGARFGTESKRGKRYCRDFGYRSWKAIGRACELQGLPADFFKHSPFTLEGAWRMLGNGVPLPMGRAIAHAVAQALMEVTP